jgi:hypothetical protein
MMKKRRFFGLVLTLAVLLFAIPALANFLTSATATADCTGFTLTVNAIDLTAHTTYTIDFTFALTCNGSTTIVSGHQTFTASGSTASVPITGSWPSPLSVNCTVMGSATLTSTGSTVTITINGSTTASLPCALVQERMTGGGTVDVSNPSTQVVVDGTDSDSFDVSHGFEIHCGAPPPKNNRLEVNWPGHHFHLETLTLGTCVCDPAFLPPGNPDAGFNEFIGAGTGKLDGKPGASIVFVFTDQGEPGTNDTEQMTIFDPSDTPVLSFPQTNLTFGNQQAHRDGGPKVPACLL